MNVPHHVIPTDKHTLPYHKLHGTRNTHKTKFNWWICRRDWKEEEAQPEIEEPAEEPKKRPSKKIGAKKIEEDETVEEKPKTKKAKKVEPEAEAEKMDVDEELPPEVEPVKKKPGAKKDVEAVEPESVEKMDVDEELPPEEEPVKRPSKKLGAKKDGEEEKPKPKKKKVEPEADEKMEVDDKSAEEPVKRPSKKLAAKKAADEAVDEVKPKSKKTEDTLAPENDEPKKVKKSSSRKSISDGKKPKGEDVVDDAAVAANNVDEGEEIKPRRQSRQKDASPEKSAPSSRRSSKRDESPETTTPTIEVYITCTLTLNTSKIKTFIFLTITTNIFKSLCHSVYIYIIYDGRWNNVINLFYLFICRKFIFFYIVLSMCRKWPKKRNRKLLLPRKKMKWVSRIGIEYFRWKIVLWRFVDL